VLLPTVRPASKKYSGMWHPTIRLFRTDFVLICTDQIRTVKPIETTTPIKAVEI